MCRNLGLSDKIFECLFTAMAKVQSADRKASFLFVGDMNAHHEELLESSTLKAARDYAICTVGLGDTMSRHRVVSRWLRSLNISMEGA